MEGEFFTLFPQKLADDETKVFNTLFCRWVSRVPVIPREKLAVRLKQAWIFITSKYFINQVWYKKQQGQYCVVYSFGGKVCKCDAQDEAIAFDVDVGESWGRTEAELRTVLGTSLNCYCWRCWMKLLSICACRGSLWLVLIGLIVLILWWEEYWSAGWLWIQVFRPHFSNQAKTRNVITCWL